MDKYETETYGTGFILRVTPQDRSADVMHYLITGHLLGSRSLDGVTWEEVDDEAMQEIQNQRAKELIQDLENAY